MIRDWRLLERSIWFVVLWFGSYASNTKLTEVLNIYVYRKPSISAADKFQCLILSKISYKDVIVVVLNDTCAKVIYK